jgi:hypothetical protein
MLFFAVSCSQIRPFVDSRREAGQEGTVGKSKPERIAICYNTLNSTCDQLQEMADVECQKIGKKAVIESADYFSCRLLTPHVTYYKCE